jgi:single-strand DNA-binding protein
MSNADAVLIGNVTRDPELRFSPSGVANTKFGLAVGFRRQNRQTQEWEETTSFFDVVCFNQLAENAAESLQKGARVIVTGRIEIRDWEGQDGKKGRSVELIADEVGPSLRWANATITRNDRRGPDGAQGGSGGPGGQQSAPAPRSDSYAEEEPF